jgi:hypothetical protein
MNSLSLITLTVENVLQEKLDTIYLKSQYHLVNLILRQAMLVQRDGIKGYHVIQEVSIDIDIRMLSLTESRIMNFISLKVERGDRLE